MYPDEGTKSARTGMGNKLFILHDLTNELFKISKCFYKRYFYILPRMSKVRGLHRKNVFTLHGFRIYSDYRDLEFSKLNNS